MDDERLVSITISVPKSYRDQLRKIVAQDNLKNPDKVTSVSELGREILCGCLGELKKKDFNWPSDEDNPIGSQKCGTET